MPMKTQITTFLCPNTWHVVNARDCATHTRARPDAFNKQINADVDRDGSGFWGVEVKSQFLAQIIRKKNSFIK